MCSVRRILQFVLRPTELTALSQARNRFYQQANENGMVQKELNELKPGANVYKMIGPVLLKQVT